MPPRFGKSSSVLREGTKVRYAFTETHKHLWPVRVQCRGPRRPILVAGVECRVLSVSASGYHQHLARRRIIDQRRHLIDEVLLVHIRAVYAENRGAYGWPRIPPQQAKTACRGPRFGGRCARRACAWASRGPHRQVFVDGVETARAAVDEKAWHSRTWQSAVSSFDNR